MKCKMVGSMVDRRIDFTFDGGLPAVQFDASRVHSGLHLHAEMHGWEARLRDVAANKKTELERRMAVNALVTHYYSGSPDWSTRGTAMPSPVIAAIATKRGCTYAEAEAYVVSKLLDELSA